MREGRGAPAILLTSLALALGAGGCLGGDDEGEEVTVPSISTEATTQSVPSQTATLSTTPTTPTTTKPSGGAADPNQPDSPTNDVPPPAGSPEERFEQYCEQNPGACG